MDVLPRLKMTAASNGMGFDENRTPLFKCFCKKIKKNILNY